jgi:hypothetical protein
VERVILNALVWQLPDGLPPDICTFGDYGLCYILRAESRSGFLLNYLRQHLGEIRLYTGSGNEPVLTPTKLKAEMRRPFGTQTNGSAVSKWSDLVDCHDI